MHVGCAHLAPNLPDLALNLPYLPDLALNLADLVLNLGLLATTLGAFSLASTLTPQAVQAC